MDSIEDVGFTLILAVNVGIECDGKGVCVNILAVWVTEGDILGVSVI